MVETLVRIAGRNSNFKFVMALTVNLNFPLLSTDIFVKTNQFSFISKSGSLSERSSKQIHCDVAGTIQGYHWLYVARYLHWEPIHTCKQRSSSHGKGL